MNVTTIRQLRGILFEIENQEMTIKELRELLFNVESQDSEMTPMDVKLAVRREEELTNSATFKKIVAKREAA